jgi:hypothetical protein
LPSPAPPRDNRRVTALPTDVPDGLDAAAGARFAEVALDNVTREYPNHPGHVLQSGDDLVATRTLHQAFYGSYDWHSSVHMHWLLARVKRLHPGIDAAPRIDALFDAHLSRAAIDTEVAYFTRPGTQSFERTYGWAWLLALATELARSADAPGRRARAALEPLVATIVARYLDHLPRARYPIRHGLHANSAFGLVLALDFARQSSDTSLATTFVAKARAWFDADEDLPARWEPSGVDFLSPALCEACLMRRALDAGAFAAWLGRALPGLGRGDPATLFLPVEVTDRADPQLVHLDGLNLSRAWCMRDLAHALGDNDERSARLRAAARLHLAAGLRGLERSEYVGAHWLATFAVLALTG